MSKNMIIGIGIVILVFAGGFALTQSQKTKTPSSETAMMKDDTTPKNNALTASQAYVEYSKAALDQTVGQRRVLFFYASWCPTCRPADADFNASVSTFPKDVTVIRVNYNDPETDQEEKDLAKQYGITYQHTFVQIDATGQEIAKWNGGQTDELLANLK